MKQTLYFPERKFCGEFENNSKTKAEIDDKIFYCLVFSLKLIKIWFRADWSKDGKGDFFEIVAKMRQNWVKCHPLNFTA